MYWKETDGFFRSPEDGPPSHLVMMRAYIDESGHEERGYVIVGGFFGSEDAWEAFLLKWRAALGQRKTLHMSSLRWKKDSTRRLLARLAPIPHECGLRPCMGGVRISDYEDLIDEPIPMLQKHGSLVIPVTLLVPIKGYEAALTPMVINVLRGVPSTERIEFVFEEQREYAPAVENVMEFASELDMSYKRTSDGKPKIAKWGFVPKGSTVMTDPADYLAFAAREHYTDETTKKAKWTRPILASGDGQAYGRILTRDEIRRRIKNSRAMFKRLYQS
jgi:hypothetical protein